MLALGGANQTAVHLDYLFGDVTAPLSVVIGLAFLCGFIFAGILWGVTIVYLRMRVRRLQKQLARLQQQEQ